MSFTLISCLRISPTSQHVLVSTMAIKTKEQEPICSEKQINKKICGKTRLRLFSSIHPQVQQDTKHTSDPLPSDKTTLFRK